MYSSMTAPQQPHRAASGDQANTNDGTISMITMRSVRKLFDDDRGATAIEYALIASLIAVALVAVLTSLGTALSSEFSEVSGVLK
jgi:pilus assembly protein Flp/PilA